MEKNYKGEDIFKKFLKYIKKFIKLEANNYKKLDKKLLKKIIIYFFTIEYGMTPDEMVKKISELNNEVRELRFNNKNLMKDICSLKKKNERLKKKLEKLKK